MEHSWVHLIGLDGGAWIKLILARTGFEMNEGMFQVKQPVLQRWAAIKTYLPGSCPYSSRRMLANGTVTGD